MNEMNSVVLNFGLACLPISVSFHPRTGGHFDAESGGHFVAELGGHYAAESGGHIRLNLQFELIIECSSLSCHCRPPVGL